MRENACLWLKPQAWGTVPQCLGELVPTVWAPKGKQEHGSVVGVCGDTDMTQILGEAPEKARGEPRANGAVWLASQPQDDFIVSGTVL